MPTGVFLLALLLVPLLLSALVQFIGDRLPHASDNRWP